MGFLDKFFGSGSAESPAETPKTKKPERVLSDNDKAALEQIALMRQRGAREVRIESVEGENLTQPMRGGAEKGTGTAGGERISIDAE